MCIILYSLYFIDSIIFHKLYHVGIPALYYYKMLLEDIMDNPSRYSQLRTNDTNIYIWVLE